MSRSKQGGSIAGWISAGWAGVIFATGLALSGMTQPSKVIGFLDIFGDWDPSLAFVMGGAVLVHALTRPLIMKRSAPVLGANFDTPAQSTIDARLLFGAALFGLGWGLVGICPGPALVGIGSGQEMFLLFVGAMIVGMWAQRVLAPQRKGSEPRVAEAAEG